MKEHSLAFGPNEGLVGTIALPDSGLAETGFVLLNAGIIHRVGPHRINVRVARYLAARGIASIRIDLAGHGDSARLTGENTFEAQAMADIRAAMDALGAAAGISRFAIFGICSGAYHGYATALSDERVAGLLMFDAYRFPTLKTHLIYYARALGEPQLASRVVNFLKRGVGAGRSWVRSSAVGAPSAQAVPRLGVVNFIPTRAEFAAGLSRLLDRGVHIRLLYSGDALVEYNYADQFRDTMAPFGIGDRIRAEFLPDVDHQFSVMADQLDVMRRIADWAEELHSVAHPVVVAEPVSWAEGTVLPERAVG